MDKEIDERKELFEAELVEIEQRLKFDRYRREDKDTDRAGHDWYRREDKDTDRAGHDCYRREDRTE